VRLAAPVTTYRVRVRITGSRLEPTLAEVGLFKQALPGAPAISERTRDGLVTVTHGNALPIVYTLDGTEPTTTSPVYRAPIALPRGGTVHAAVVTSDGRLGLSTSKSFVGLALTGWKLVGSTDATAVNAIDADAKTLWRTRAADQALAIDMGRVQRIGGFAYLPRQDWVFEGVVDRYRFETSVDGNRWTTQVDAGAFSNIRNNPMQQEVRFAPVEARYFRFTPLRDTDNTGWVGAAEITVLPASL
jgi:alpha-L-fucosidase